MSDFPPDLDAFADAFPFCAVCWARGESVALHIHHIVGGASGRNNDRRNLLRLCMWCHEGLHFGGKHNLTKGMILTAKREVDDEFYDPVFLASLKHKKHLGYGPGRYPALVFAWRRKHGIPRELLDMGRMQREKGKRGEREAADKFNEFVPKAGARRAVQYSGTEGTSDLIAPGCPHLWIEVKRVQALNLTAVMQTSREQCGELCPVVLHRKDDSEWLVTLPLDQIKRFVQQINGAL